MAPIKKLDEDRYNLNHAYPKAIDLPLIASGATYGASTTQIQLFDKSLALASNIVKLPVLRSITWTFYIQKPSSLGTTLEAANVNGIDWLAQLINKDAYDAEYSIDSTNLVFYHSDADQNTSWGGQVSRSRTFAGGILLSPTIAVYVSSVVGVAAALDIAIQGQILMHLEIDWIEVTKAQFKDFILEHVYSKE